MILDGFTEPIVCFALEREAKYFLDGFAKIVPIANALNAAFLAESQTNRIGIVILGIGAQNTERVLTWLFERTRPSKLLIAGYSGALTPQLKIGDVVWIQEVIDESGRSWSTTLDWKMDLKPPGIPKFHFEKKLITAARFIDQPAEKQQLHSRFLADAVDMESVLAVQMCVEKNIPIGVVRVISDEVDTRLSPRLISLISNGKPSLCKVLKTILVEPRTLPQMIRIANHTRRASQNLSLVLHQWLGFEKTLENDE